LLIPINITLKNEYAPRFITPVSDVNITGNETKTFALPKMTDDDFDDSAFLSSIDFG